MSQPRLDYAPRPPFHRRKRFRRLIIISSLIVGVASTYFWGPSAWRCAQIIYWQNRCLDYAAPADDLVLETGSAARLIYRQTNAPWTHYEHLAAGTSGLSPTCAFLHQMNRPDGQARLVVVFIESLVLNESSVESGFKGTAAVFDSQVLSPNSFGRPMVWHNFGGTASVDITNAQSFKVYAGQIDPMNPSHLTIDYDLDGQRGAIDGWLDDHDSLQLINRFQIKSPSQ